MLWKQTIAAFLYALVLNAWLANKRPELQPDLDWQPVIIDHNGDVR